MTNESSAIYHPRIVDLPEGERPRERLRHYGAGSLSNAELLAIMLRVGNPGENVVAMGTRLLVEFGGLKGLAKADFGELLNSRGLGEAKIAQIKAALELGRRLLIASPDARPQITSPNDAANFFMLEMSHLEQEHLCTLLLDTKSYVLGNHTVYIGNVNSSMVRVGEVFRRAVRENATSIIVAHNHPSGDPTPSQEDIKVTRSFVEAGRLLNIEVLDHLVIGYQHFISLREQGLGFD
jgi:DNA repair protein RadC